ncbi:hypothetical protein LTR53_003476 [Teratosphaeriaceae sp. CCFEE 6253]|nr:hypothetical protein LTR53_003476 [Teratosphaeriaceae sp. CCFEE 6253]
MMVRTTPADLPDDAARPQSSDNDTYNFMYSAYAVPGGYLVYESTFPGPAVRLDIFPKQIATLTDLTGRGAGTALALHLVPSRIRHPRHEHHSHQAHRHTNCHAWVWMPSGAFGVV